MSEVNGRFDRLELPDGKKGVPWPEEERDSFLCLESADNNYYQGFFELALREYARALKYNKGLIPAWVGQVKSLLDLKEIPEAEVWVNNALSYFPKSAELLAAKAAVLCEQGKVEEAMVYSDNSLGNESSAENSWYPWVVRSRLLFFMRGKKTAKICLEKAVEENPNNWRLLMEVGKVYLKYRRFIEALLSFNKARDIEPGNAFLWFYLAKCHQGLHNRSQVRLCCERALELRCEFPEVQELLNSCREKFWAFR
ncbi:MAG: hypothetical protein V2A65_02160 [Candidatus Omnitrophota bacterium]